MIRYTIIGKQGVNPTFAAPCRSVAHAIEYLKACGYSVKRVELPPQKGGPEYLYDIKKERMAEPGVAIGAKFRIMMVEDAASAPRRRRLGRSKRQEQQATK